MAYQAVKQTKKIKKEINKIQTEAARQGVKAARTVFPNLETDEKTKEIEDKAFSNPFGLAYEEFSKGYPQTAQKVDDTVAAIKEAASQAGQPDVSWAKSDEPPPKTWEEALEQGKKRTWENRTKMID